jgi:hypothetical protein
MLRHLRPTPKPVTADKHALCRHLKRRQAAAIVALMLSGSVFVKGVSAVEILLATLALVAVAAKFHALDLSSASFARTDSGIGAPLWANITVSASCLLVITGISQSSHRC